MTVGWTFLVSEERLRESGVEVDRRVLEVAMQMLQQVLFESQEGAFFELVQTDPSQVLQFCPGYGYYDNPVSPKANGSFTIGFRHLHRSRQQEVETLIWDTL